MKNYLIIALFSMFLISCQTESSEPKYPACFQKIIGEILLKSPNTPRSKIESYNYNNTVGFIINEGGEIYPDRQYSVVDEKCNQICTLGGIGVPITDCKNWNEATFIEIVWEDPR